ncbi:probable serine/threonine-protein kinase MARK-A [Ictalurus punctatus]|uniref:non-specific serine/threonine protein kinase n=1 Tax=Ictalurus punctatus TaxID=7998 RepID=A0A2D0PJ27_ICTPU|nr:probable serine/threonine-protein kinase MARK-A [Ictalurus punctatus]
MTEQSSGYIFFPEAGNMYKPEEPDDEAAFPGPLLTKKMQKDSLIRFMVQKSQECLNATDIQDPVETYFFWQIMELFCRQNGKVMMYEVGTLLFRGYGMLRKKSSELRGVKNYKNWCLPLAQLVCSNSPDGEHRELMIKMGDDFASRGLTYAAHICYVVAKVELGSHGQFDLIGCNRLPFGLRILSDIIQTTETYEYVLSLTSGRAQPNFQIFKLYYASRLTMIALYDLAIAYCETIARAVITFPGSFKRTFMERVILLSCNLHKELQEENEAEWLLELRRLHSVKVADANANANAVPEQRMPSTSSDLGSEIQDPITGEIPAYDQHTDPEDVFDSRYTMGELLGKGGFGSVYAGVRNEDGKQVAIKYVNKRHINKLLNIPGEKDNTNKEVTLLRMVSRPPCCSNIVALLEWFDMPAQVVLVLERPIPCMNLKEFTKLQNGCLSEAQTRDIMLQVIQAARHCCDRGVLHRDIKAQNLLINTDTLQVKLIDFGCGDLLKDTPYKKYAGTPAFWPPERVLFEDYNGIPATIWGLGILLSYLLVGKYPFNSKKSFDDAYLNLCPGVSRELLELLIWCLDFNPQLRPTFEDLLRHEWFVEGIQDKV